MTRKALLFMIVSAVFAGGLNGCEWKDTTYDAYVKDGRVVSCPPEIDGKSVQFPTLTCHDTTIEYHHGSIDNMDSCLDTTNKCKPDAGCAHCNTYLLDYLACMNFRNNGFFALDENSLLAKQLSFMGSDQNNNSIGAYSEAAQHQICPKDYPICGFRKNNDGKGEFGCVEDNVTIECGDGENTNVIKCGNDCVDISLDPNNCGGCGMECKGDENSHAHEFSCENRTCIPKSCKTGFHLSDGECVEDSADACGPGVIDCTQIQGWKESKCENGVCVASECYENFHLNDKVCEVDSVMDCGSKGHACETKEGVKQVACIDGNCVDFLCDENYHKSQNEMSCKKDEYGACGSWNNNCASRVGWLSNSDEKNDNGMCENGICKALNCQLGYHVDNKTNSCVQDSNKSCGVDAIDCDADDGKICSNGNCVASCSENETQCPDGCFNIMHHVSHCGSCNNKCDTNELVVTTCSGGSCHYQCPEGMGDCNGNMQDGCETELRKYGLEYEDGKCRCGKEHYICDDHGNQHPHGAFTCTGDQLVQCGMRKTEDDIDVPLCILNLDKYGLNEYGIETKRCGCAEAYVGCGEVEQFIGTNSSRVTIPLCILKHDYGLESSGDTCKCAEPYTQCGTTKANIGVSDKYADIPLCLKQGDFYTNYSTNGSDSNQFRHNAKQNNVDVYYDYKVSQCQLAVSYWYDNYRYLGNKQYGWQGKDKWSSETCAILCNSQEQIRNSNPKEGISNENVNVTFAHRCNPKSVCHQSAEFDGQSSNGFYYNYGCKDGPDGYYKQKNCNE